MIRAELNPGLEIRVEPTDDLRSYHLSGRKAEEELGFRPKRDLVLAVQELQRRYEGPTDEDYESAWFRNVKWMKERGDLWR